jgi:hypothetical protein
MQDPGFETVMRVPPHEQYALFEGPSAREDAIAYALLNDLTGIRIVGLAPWGPSHPAWAQRRYGPITATEVPQEPTS